MSQESIYISCDNVLLAKISRNVWKMPKFMSSSMEKTRKKSSWQMKDKTILLQFFFTSEYVCSAFVVCSILVHIIFGPKALLHNLPCAVSIVQNTSLETDENAMNGRTQHTWPYQNIWHIFLHFSPISAHFCHQIMKYKSTADIWNDIIGENFKDFGHYDIVLTRFGKR